MIFALALLGFSVVLLAQTPYQTRWIEKAEFFAQPRFWPALSLGLMTVLGLAHLLQLPWRRFQRADRAEVVKWATVLEFAGWFMAYVLVVPVIGYLPATVIYVPVLGWRLGYRTRKMIAIGILFAVVTVVVFKSFLSVKIPGGMIYEYLPGSLRSFFILYL